MKTVKSFTILTSAPGPDAAQYHDRQPVILEPADWTAWLDPSQPVERLLRPPVVPGHLLITHEVRAA